MLEPLTGTGAGVGGGALEAAERALFPAGVTLLTFAFERGAEEEPASSTPTPAPPAALFPVDLRRSVGVGFLGSVTVFSLLLQTEGAVSEVNSWIIREED